MYGGDFLSGVKSFFDTLNSALPIAAKTVGLISGLGIDHSLLKSKYA